MLPFIALSALAAIILVAVFAALDAHRWQARQRPRRVPRTASCGGQHR